MQNAIIEKMGTPTMVINGGVGGTSIQQHLPDPNNRLNLSTIYGSWLYRVIQSGSKDRIRWLFWYQGESNSGADDYTALFDQLRNAWLEDLPNLLARGDCMVAGAGDKLWGFLCVALNGSGWAYLRGAAIVNGWRTDDALSAVLEPLQTRLSERGATHLAAYGTALWLVPALQRAGFQRREWIINLERHSRPLTLDEVPDVQLRPVAAYDVDQIGALDKAAFAAPFQLEEGELIELLITSGQFAVAELAGFDELAGYVAADVTGDEGHIMRLATHPALHGRGIGRTLLNGALAYCEQSGARTVGINTQDSN